jgi:putative peptidoglycan lipid II flippase
VTDASPPTPAKKSSLLRSSLTFSSFTLLSRLFGFARDMAVNTYIGASGTIVADTFIAALQFPNLFRRIFAEGAFAAAFVPTYSQMLEKDEEAADRLAADAMATLATATVALTIVVQLAMPWLGQLIFYGWRDTPEKVKLAILLTQITMPYLPFMAIYAHLSGVLNARGRFALSAAAPILLNLWTLAFILPQHDPKAAATWGSVGVLLAGLSQALVLMWGCHRSGAKVHWSLPKLTPEIKSLLARAVPGSIAASAIQVNIFVSGWIANFGPNGSRAWLNAADRLYQLPLGLVGVAIGVALLPRLSRAVQSKDHGDAQDAMDQAITFAMALTIPAAAAMVSIPFFLSDGINTRGQTTTYDALNMAHVLFFYGLGTPAFVLQQLYSRAFFARLDTRSPMRFALISVAANILLGIGLFFVIGIPGIAAATSISSWLNVGQMAFTLARRKDYTPVMATWSRLLRILIASAALGGLLALVSHFRPVLEAPLAFVDIAGQIRAKEILLALTVLGALLVYPPLLFASGGLKVSEVKAAIRRKKSDPAPTLPETGPSA